MFGQLYIFANVELGKTMALFGATSIILSNLLGLFLLNEILSPAAYIGLSLTILAFLILAFF
jgi:multidrug transporter EmrE-like cation transporter